MKGTVAFVLLAVVAGVLWIAVSAMLSDFHGGDAAGRGMAKGFAVVAAFALWLVLGILLLVAMGRGSLRGALLGAAAGVVLAAGVAHLAGLFLLSDLPSGARFESLLRVAVLAIPPVVLTLLSAGLGTSTTASALARAAGAVLLVLSAATLTAWAPVKRDEAARRAEQQARWDAQQRQEAAWKAEIAAIPDDAPLELLLPYASVGSPSTTSEARSLALERMRKLPRRQEDAERLLENGDLSALRSLSDLDLKMTPRLCTGAQQALFEVAERYRVKATTATFDSIEDELTTYTRHDTWLVENGCDARAAFEALTEMARAYPPSFARDRFVDYLKHLSGKIGA